MITIELFTQLLSIAVLIILYVLSFIYLFKNRTVVFAFLLLLFLHIIFLFTSFHYFKTLNILNNNIFSKNFNDLLEPLKNSISVVFPSIPNLHKFFPFLILFLLVCWFFLFLALCYMVDTFRRIRLFNNAEKIDTYLGKSNLSKLNLIKKTLIYSSIILFIFLLFFLCCSFQIISFEIILSYFFSILIFISSILLIVLSLISFIYSLHINNSFHFISK